MARPLGSVDVNVVLADAAIVERPLEARWLRAAGLGGTCLPNEWVRETSRIYEAKALFKQGLGFQELALHLAVRSYGDAIKYQPKFREARLGLAECLETLGHDRAATSGTSLGAG